MRLRSCQSPDFFQKIGCGLTGLQRGKFLSQFQHLRRGASGAKGLFRAGAAFKFGPRMVRPGRVALSRINRIPQVVAGKDMVASAAQQFPQVGQHIRGLVDAQNREAGLRSPRRRGLSPVKSQDGFFLGCMGVKQGDQVGHFQDFVNVLRNVAQLQIASGAARAGQQPHQHSQSAAVDENYFAQVQHDVDTIAQELADMLAQDFGFTGHDASAAADDGDLLRLRVCSVKVAQCPLAGPERQVHESRYYTELRGFWSDAAQNAFVILRKWSPSRSDGLRTKDLCISYADVCRQHT